MLRAIYFARWLRNDGVVGASAVVGMTRVIPKPGVVAEGMDRGRRDL